MAEQPDLHPDSRAAHAGMGSGTDGTGAVSPPLHFATTFAKAPDGSLPGGHIYSRESNPTRATLEAALASLEGAADAAAFGSGLAAIAAVWQALAPGDCVLAPTDMYHGARTQLRELMAPWGLDHVFVDMADLAAVRQALAARPIRLVWLETPSNPLLGVTDIAAIAEMAHATGALVATDNTFATPLLQRPLALGADLVMHSTTKYLGGHSDLLGGALMVQDAASPLWARIRQIQTYGGAVPSPFDCWLLLRGMRSLPARLPRHCASARAVAEWLEAHPRVARVHYPGLASHPGHAVAARQMAGFGGMLSFELKDGGAPELLGVAGRLRLFTHATSLGGTESLAEVRDTGMPGLHVLRLSIGLEHAPDLIDDLAQALQARA